MHSLLQSARIGKFSKIFINELRYVVSEVGSPVVILPPGEYPTELFKQPCVLYYHGPLDGP
jgi:hypothetical protein